MPRIVLVLSSMVAAMALVLATTGAAYGQTEEDYGVPEGVQPVKVSANTLPCPMDLEKVQAQHPGERVYCIEGGGYAVAKESGAEPKPQAKPKPEKLNLVICEPQDVACIGTAAPDRFGGNIGWCGTINGKGGDDRILLPKTKGNGCFSALKGDTGNDRLVGKTGAYILDGGPGNDYMRGGHLMDDVNAGPGRDTVSTGGGNDSIRTQDGERDHVFCGDGGFDSVIADKQDVVSADCETIRGVR